MKYSLKGRIQATVCDNHQQALANTIIRLYYSENEGVTELVAAPSKELFQVLDEEMIQAKQKRLLTETTTDARGHYEIKIDSEQNAYEGQSLELNAYYPEIPDYGQQDTSKPSGYAPFQAVLDVWQPRWTASEETDEPSAQSNHRISRKWWCTILQELDIWSICGTLYGCETEAPQAGIEVIAMDDDIISDDLLGSAITDTAGKFCIFYRSKDFKKTFLSPLINVETPFAATSNGPDIYFKFALGGSVFFAEEPSEARKPSRENADNCVCVDLCIDSSKGEPITSFFHVGDYRRYNIVLNIDPSDGRTTNKTDAGWNRQAFYGTLALLGTLEKTFNGQSTEYLFQYAELASPAEAIPTNEAAWTDVVKSDIASGTIIGFTPKLVTSPTPPPPFYYEPDIYAINPQPGQIEVAFNGNWTVVPQTAQSLTGRLINLISEKLASGRVNMSGLVPGESSAPLQKNRYFSLRMKKREAGNAASETVAGTSRPIAIFNTTYEDVLQGGSWSPGRSSELGIATLDLAELATAGGCSKIDNTITVKYTAANPNLGDVRFGFKRPGATNNFEPINFSTPGEEAQGTALYSGNFAALKNCAYEIQLTAGLKLTNGEKTHDGIQDRVLFCR